MKRLLLSFLSIVLAVGCGSKPDPATPGDPPKASSGSPVETYFPLEQGNVFSYALTDTTGTGAVSFHVERTDATHGKLVVTGSNKVNRFVYEKDGVANDGGGSYILKAPLDVGNSWPGDHGGQMKIVKTDATAKVGGKTFASCVVTQEDATRPPNTRYSATYCPGVGMVLFEVVSTGGDAKGELLYFGPPVKMEQGTSVKIEKSN